MSGDAKKPSFKSAEELWGYIEEQEALLNQLDDVFSKVGKKQKPHQELSKAPAPFAEMEHMAREGSPAAQFNLSIAYKAGEGVARDLKKATSWLLKSAEAGFPPAQYNIGHYWLDANDKEKAFDWFMMAAKQNYGPAQFHIGALCGNSGDYVRAYVWSYLAKHNRVDEARGNLEKLVSLLSEEELNEARVAVSAFMMDFREKGMMR
jgi:TPR repeat protein